MIDMTHDQTDRGSTSHGRTSQAIYDRHQALFYELLEHLKRIEQADDVDQFPAFLAEQLLPQVFDEEAYLYPSLHERGTMTDTMSVDHEFIEAYVRRIERAVTDYRQAAPGEQVAARREIAKLGRQLEAILELHLTKEDHIYLPLIERLREPGGEAAPAKDGGHPRSAVRPGGMDVMDMVDVRGLSPIARQARTFAAFGALSAGETFLLVSDRDPAPLFYQLTFEYQGQLVWEPLEHGPDTWRVTIGKGTRGG